MRCIAAGIGKLCTVLRSSSSCGVKRCDSEVRRGGRMWSSGGRRGVIRGGGDGVVIVIVG